MSKILEEARTCLVHLYNLADLKIQDNNIDSSLNQMQSDSYESIKEALDLLEQYEQKEKGVKPTHTTKNQQEYYYCKCDNEVGICEDDGTWYIKEKYCSECGIKIDWSDENEL